MVDEIDYGCDGEMVVMVMVMLMMAVDDNEGCDDGVDAHDRDDGVDLFLRCLMASPPGIRESRDTTMRWNKLTGPTTARWSFCGALSMFSLVEVWLWPGWTHRLPLL